MTNIDRPMLTRDEMEKTLDGHGLTIEWDRVKIGRQSVGGWMVTIHDGEGRVIFQRTRMGRKNDLFVQGIIWGLEIAEWEPWTIT